MGKKPQNLSGIIARTGEFGSGRGDFEEGVNGGNGESAEDVAVRQGEEEPADVGLDAELFAHFADAAFMERLAGIDEASGEVERALRGLLRAAYDEEIGRAHV